jgi:hypothetical protein
MNSLKMVWKLRERKKILESRIASLEKAYIAVPAGSAAPMLFAREDELKFIKELLGET